MQDKQTNDDDDFVDNFIIAWRKIFEEEGYDKKYDLSYKKLFSCDHEFKEYIGFTEKYNYCIKCNKKEQT